ncbi:MAG: RsmD family RNA methyltransferase, partial [Bacteroidales bacterium]|nr:RsmD family RNA methyltransferase [Bacteroidales bacterium]
MLNEALKEFIRQNFERDLSKIILSSGSYPDIDIKLAATIIDARKRLRFKVPEWAKNEELIFINSTSIEQSSSEVTALHKQRFISGGIVVDLTGGLGVDSYYFSRNNKKVIYFERDTALYSAVSHNFKKLKADNIVTINVESDQKSIPETLQLALKINSDPFVDLIYIDPSRRKSGNRRVLAIRDYEPDITVLKDNLLKYSKRVLIKVSPMTDIKSFIMECGNISSVDIVSVENECKEVLFEIDRDCTKDYDRVEINALNYSRGINTVKISFTPKEERESISSFTEEEQMRYLYEPNASILKAGAFKYTGVKYNLKKLAHSTHLYSSEEYVENFPGKVYTVKEIADYCKNTIRNLRKIYP